jgi:quinol monooxygenase YgiN
MPEQGFASYLSQLTAGVGTRRYYLEERTMVIVAGTIEFATEDRESLFAQIRQLMADSKAEAGCIVYEFSLDLTKDDLLHLYEVWETLEALDVHNASPHMAAFRDAAFPSFVETDIKRYNAEPAD